MMRTSMKQVIQRRFAESKLSIRRLSIDAKLPYSAAYGAITGTTDPCLSTVEKICRVLELELGLAKKAGKDE